MFVKFLAVTVIKRTELSKSMAVQPGYCVRDMHVKTAWLTHMPSAGSQLPELMPLRVLLLLLDGIIGHQRSPPAFVIVFSDNSPRAQVSFTGEERPCIS